MAGFLGLVLLGFAVGGLGTLIGAGGGFILMPILLLLHPKANQDMLTAVSLAVVFFNASSGTVAYARMKRVDFRSGIAFLMSGVPGAVVGAILVKYVPRTTFDVIFGVTLVMAAMFLLHRSRRTARQPRLGRGTYRREMVDADGNRHDYSYNLRLGMAIGFFVGLFSSFFGVGGGFIHVPVMSQILGFPVHVATATSLFILAVMALAGSIVHLIDGSLLKGLYNVIPLAIGVLIGAPLGARLSRRVHGKWIIRLLAVALGTVGARIFLAGLLALLKPETSSLPVPH